MPGITKPREIILLLLTIIGIASIFFMDPIPQDENYHQFADRRTHFTIPHFWNVVSNIPLSVIGALGMFFILKQNKDRFIPFRWNKFIFFLGIFLTGFGSAYYHLNPTNNTLLWDRLPMTIAFMSFFSIIISEFVCNSSGRNFLLPFLTLGCLSIIYWQMTANRGCADLRFYVLIQFLPMILIPLILITYKSKGDKSKLYWFILAAYVIAKVLEATDHFFYHSGYVLSGHTIKHIAATVGPLLLFIYEIKQTKECL
jgi:peptidoglycan/LPS O-acetylase OafA/YrhL